jgi:two-component system, LuxR family, sensor kinase FixL
MSGADIELLVADNGGGLDPTRIARGGMGLRVMRFRAQMIGGYLAVESRPAAGTTLRCRVPVQPERAMA